MTKRLHRNSPLAFLLLFLGLNLILYYGHVVIYSLTNHGNNYNAFFDEHLNYFRGLRHLLLGATKFLVELLGFTCVTNDYQLLVAGRGVIYVAYDCLGLGVMDFFIAFVIAYPYKLKPKLFLLFTGLICIQILNVLRFVLLALFWDKKSEAVLNHHTIFNIIVYIIIAISIYFWVKRDDKPVAGAKN